MSTLRSVGESSSLRTRKLSAPNAKRRMPTVRAMTLADALGSAIVRNTLRDNVHLFFLLEPNASKTNDNDAATCFWVPPVRASALAPLSTL
jgi:hypothetical protein